MARLSPIRFLCILIFLSRTRLNTWTGSLTFLKFINPLSKQLNIFTALLKLSPDRREYPRALPRMLSVQQDWLRVR